MSVLQKSEAHQRYCYFIDVSLHDIHCEYEIIYVLSIKFYRYCEKIGLIPQAMYLALESSKFKVY